MLELSTAQVTATIDPGYGADVLSLVDRASGIDVLFRSPWRERADAIRQGHPASSFDPVAGRLERYRGGWQTLCPVAGAPRTVHGAPLAFHGEVSNVAWIVDEVTGEGARLHVELFSIPLRIDRRVHLTGATLTITDELRNLSATALEFDYTHHPAFGGEFLDGDVRIETGAARFTTDPETPGALVVPSPRAWSVPGPTEPAVVFGWIDEFTDFEASITNVDRQLAVRLRWSGEHLPYAWVWEELNGTAEYPWYGRARVVAIEPASTQTSGPDRRSVMRLAPHDTRTISIAISLENGAFNG